MPTKAGNQRRAGNLHIKGSIDLKSPYRSHVQNIIDAGFFFNLLNKSFQFLGACGVDRKPDVVLMIAPVIMRYIFIDVHNLNEAVYFFFRYPGGAKRADTTELCALETAPIRRMIPSSFIFWTRRIVSSSLMPHRLPTIKYGCSSSGNSFCRTFNIFLSISSIIYIITFRLFKNAQMQATVCQAKLTAYEFQHVSVFIIEFMMTNNFLMHAVIATLKHFPASRSLS